ncbi:MAG TPA: gamma-glutamyltransferase family protein [Thermotogota bacterium]|nr:gamma-glutamyltransferase family protein [Thermotogota bacterium]HPJ87803.1 gamma-glutamyltransferase family protein [Thermotogota bacterium]HPR95199.1 gamma-glutamyltransferase family protein [Thermotogota bacterium]
MKFNIFDYPYESRRNCLIAQRGVVATSNPLAAQAGLEILMKGGNAVDAAIATAMCLTIVEPTSNGIGGDNFAIISKGDKLYGLNSSGYSPQNISIEKLKEKGIEKIDRFGWEAVTVPGAPMGWAACSEKFGKLSLEECAKPAIRYARTGFPLQPTVSENWKNAFDLYTKTLDGERYRNWFDTFSFNGQAPEMGKMVYLKNHADTLEKIAVTDAKAFYNGELMEKIVTFSEETGGYFIEDDFRDFRCEFVEPVGINYRGYDIWEIPPNGQGIIASEALAILEGFECHARDPLYFHHQIEALKLAFEDGKKYITQSDKMAFDYHKLLEKAYIEERRTLICPDALLPAAGNPTQSGTVYLATADQDGMMVSFIQSNYMGFGSGLVVPGTGIALQNRGHSFSLDRHAANALEGHKRPYHTIIPGFITKDGKSIGPFGVMGGFMQPQGHLQVISNMVDFQLNPQSALDAPRWQWTGERNILIEKDFTSSIAHELARKGHKISVSLNSNLFGRGQIILKNPEGIYIAGTEKRTDGHIALW